MMPFRSILLAGIVLMIATPASAQDDDDYRGDRSDLGNYDGDATYSGSDVDVRNSNYNYNRDYLQDQRSGNRAGPPPRDPRITDTLGESSYDLQRRARELQGNTGGLGINNDSNSYTGQRSTTR